MNHIIDLCIKSGLIKVEFKNEYINNFKQDIPDKTFGVFSTVMRSQRLKKWPEDIHGCIGYWDDDYQNLSHKTIIKKIIQVSNDATHRDSRKNYFKNPIYLDLNSEYELTFMLNPIHLINNESGFIKDLNKQFDNSLYGLIVQDKSNSRYRATYLPKVFEDISWNEIKDSLINKAGISNDNIVFYAYDTVIYQKKIIDYLIEPMINHINDYYKDHPIQAIPYSITKSLKVISDDSQDVRNMGLISDIVLLKTRGFKFDDIVEKVIKANLNEYIKKFNSDPNEYRQASAFLLLALHNYNNKEYESDIKIISKYLYENLDNLEQNFEYGEVLMALTYANPIQEILSKHQNIMYERLNKIDLKDDSIFGFNWQAQFLHALHIQKIITKSLNNHSIMLSKLILKSIKNYDILTETNYLAVGYEALTALYNMIDDDNNLIKSISDLFILLENKKNEIGLYKFNDGSCRLDITGHVVNGIMNIDNEYYKYKNNKEKYKIL
jgi:AMMECR1 domain-containing protein